MAIEFGFYNSLNGDRRYNSTQMSEIFEGLITDGIYPSVGEMFAVTPGEGLQILVGTGRAWFDATWTRNRAKYPMNLDIPDPVFDRIDTVCLKIDKRQGVRANSLEILKGAISTTPTAPTLPTTDPDVIYHPLANVRIKPAASSITASNITVLVGTSACPFTTSILQQTNIDVLFANWAEQFMSWWDNLKTILDDDAVGNILNELDKKVNVADKATSAEALAGTNDTHWMTPALVKSARTTALAAYHPTAVGNILFSVTKPSETRYKNLGMIQRLATTGASVPLYIGSKPKVLSIAASKRGITSYYHTYMYNGVLCYLHSASDPQPSTNMYISTIQIDSQFFTSYKVYAYNSSAYPSYCIGMVPINTTTLLVFNVPNGSGNLTSQVIALSTSAGSMSVTANTTWAVSSDTFSAGNVTILGTYLTGTSLMVIVANGVPGGSFTKIYTFTYNTSSLTTAPTVVTTSFSGYYIVPFQSYAVPHTSLMCGGLTTYAGSILVYNSSKQVSLIGISKTGSALLIKSSIFTFTNTDVAILDWDKDTAHVYLYYLTTGPKYNVAKINTVTGTIVTIALTSANGNYGIYINGYFYNGILYTNLGTNIANSGLTFPTTYARRLTEIAEFSHNVAGIWAVTLNVGTSDGAMSYLNPASYPLVPPTTSLRGYTYKSDGFVVGYWSTGAEYKYTISVNLITGACTVINNVYGTSSSYYSTYGLFAATDTYTRDIICAPLIGTLGSSTTYDGEYLMCKFDRVYMDVRDDPLAPYMWVYI